MKKLFFGTAGIPICAEGLGTKKGIEKVRALGLDAMELEFVHSINISKEKAPEIKNVKQRTGIELTCHAPYYINLNAKEKQKIGASKARILNSAVRAWECGAYSCTFHPGFYMKQAPEKVYEKIKQEIASISKKLDGLGIDIWLRPETTGKPTQFGEIVELIRISSEIDRVLPCIDFSHLHARTNGLYNTEKEFQFVLDELKDNCGSKSLKELHLHVSGINYSEKGEKNHVTLKESDMHYRELLRVLKKNKCAGVLICESPNIEEDALLLKKEYEKI